MKTHTDSSQASHCTGRHTQTRKDHAESASLFFFLLFTVCTTNTIALKNATQCDDVSDWSTMEGEIKK